MSKIRVHELAKELGRQNREIMEILKAGGIDVKSHMSNIEEAQALMVKEKIRQMRKEQVIKVDTPKTEEKTINVKPEAEKAGKSSQIREIFVRITGCAAHRIAVK